MVLAVNVNAVSIGVSACSSAGIRCSVTGDNSSAKGGVFGWGGRIVAGDGHGHVIQVVDRIVIDVRFRGTQQDSGAGADARCVREQLLHHQGTSQLEDTKHQQHKDN